MHKYRLEYYDADTDELIASYEGTDLDALHTEGYHHLERGYGVEIDLGEIKVIHHRSITAVISPCKQGYDCNVVDTLGNDVSWHINAQTMPEAVSKAERLFNSAIHYLRGFIILPTFLERVVHYDCA